MEANTNELINLTGAATIDLEAAAGENKRPTFSIDAYGGGILRLGHTSWVVDLAGMKAAASVPVLLDHDHRAIVGQAHDVKISAAGVSLSGGITGEDEHATKVLTHARNGFRWQASVGLNVEATERIGEGKTATVNDRTVTGPLLVARRTTLREVSLLAVGADQNSKASIKARHGGNAMEDQVVAGTVEAERARVMGINAAFAGLPDAGVQRDELIRDGADLATAQAVALGLLKASRPPAPGPRRQVRGDAATDGTTLQAGFLKLLGLEGLGEKAVGPEAMQRGADLRAGSMVELCAAALRLEGRDVPGSRDSMIRASFSTTSLPSALGAGIDKILVARIAEHAGTWRSVAKKVPVPNFNAQTLVSVAMGGGRLQQVAPTGEIKHGTLDESVGTVKAETFGQMLSITRHDIINDNLGVFSAIPSLAASKWSGLLGDLVWCAVMENAGAFFDASNGNYFEGADSALDIDSLSHAVALLRAMTDGQGNVLDIPPTTLVVPPGLEMTARSLLNSAELDMAGSGAPTGNPVRGIAALEIEPRLSATGYAGSSSTAWFLFGPSYLGAVCLALLNGRETPLVETQESDFNKLGLSWRIYGDAGAALHERRAAVRSKGSS